MRTHLLNYIVAVQISKSTNFMSFWHRERIKHHRGVFITLLKTQPTRSFLWKQSISNYNHKQKADKKDVVCSILLTLHGSCFLNTHWAYFKTANESCANNIIIKAALAVCNTVWNRMLMYGCFEKWLCQLKVNSVLPELNRIELK